MQKKIIFNLIKEYPVQNIENAFVQIFLNNHNIIVMNNYLLLSIINDNSDITNAIKSQIKPPKDIYELEKIFELLIPDNDRKLNGAFYTPQKITDYISNELITSEEQLICDPSCGCGAFLISAIEKIHNKYQKPVSNIIAENIYGADILKYSIRRCKILLSLLALLHNQDLQELRFNLYTVNSLSDKVYDVFKPVIDNGGFDLIIGNPPYVKYQDLSKELREDLISNWETIKKGNFNLYYAFFELGINILKKDGLLGYIVPNNYFTSLAGINLRNYLQKNCYLYKIIDFSHLKIFDVQTYTCITFLRKNKNLHFKYEKIINNKFSLNNLNFSSNFFDDLDIKKWRLMKENDLYNIKKIESLPLKLKDIADIRVGIATCRDNIYFVSEKEQSNRSYYLKEYKNTIYKIEKDITRKISRISDFSSEESLLHNNRHIIFPYKKVYDKISIIPENELKKKYPFCYEYLLAVKGELQTRDKGQISYPAWYAYARTQGLCYIGKKLLTPTFSEKPRFIFDNDESTLFCNGYAIFAKNSAQCGLYNNGFDLTILQKILNSSIMNYYIKNTSVSIDGGYFCYQKNFIESFGIPEFSLEELIFLDKTNDKEKIDKFLNDKYDLNLNFTNIISESIFINT